MLLGDKNIFAVEFEITRKYKEDEHPFIFIQSIVYLDNHPVGHWNSHDLMGVLVGTIRSFGNINRNKNINNDTKNLLNLSDAELTRRFFDLDNYDKYGFSVGFAAENFDDYHFAISAEKGVVVFIWRLERRRSRSKREKNAYIDDSNKTYIAKIDQSYINNVAIEFEKIFWSEMKSIE